MIFPTIFSNIKYKLPLFYKAQKPLHFEDQKLTDEYQDEVYAYAHQLAIGNMYESVIDIGCGSGFKLMKYFEKFQTIGVETEPCFSFLKQQYPTKKWLLSANAEKDITLKNLQADIVICCDVIEHFERPEKLLSFLKTINFKKLIISTPDRAVLIQQKKATPNGPAWNPCHAREWSFEELSDYISVHFKITKAFHCQIQKECMVFELIS
jgi:SAM-dependent methyltransferase